MIEPRKEGSEDRVTFRNGQKVESSKAGSVTGIVADKKERK